MMAYYALNFLASTYGSGDYGTSTYNGTTATSGTTSTGSGSGTLSNTGIAIVSIVSVAAVILLVAMAVRIWRRPKRAAETVESDDDPNQ